METALYGISERDFEAETKRVIHRFKKICVIVGFLNLCLSSWIPHIELNLLFFFKLEGRHMTNDFDV